MTERGDDEQRGEKPLRYQEDAGRYAITNQQDQSLACGESLICYQYPTKRAQPHESQP